MTEQSNPLKKLSDIATDPELHADLRTKAIEQIGGMRTREALLVLLELAANEELVREERTFAVRQAGEIVKSGH